MNYSKYEMIMRPSAVYESKLDHIVRSADDAGAFAVDVLEAGTYPEEHIWAVSCDVQGNIIGVIEVSKGTISCAVCEPREVFRLAIMQNAAAIILVHNHPTGNPWPSGDDEDMTKRMADAGTILGIKVLDHIVVGGNRYESLKQLHKL